jgi:hypothetical protein
MSRLADAARGNLRFGDLIRLDPWPDFRNADTTAVHMGFACGANLRGVEKWCQLTGTPTTGPWIILDLSTEQAGKLGIYVAAYRTAPAEAATSPATVGWPESWGFLYVMESAMPFAQFSRIAEQNSFPAELEAITPYVLNTPDGHRFEFAIFPEENPYKARITRYDQTGLADLNTLPLADGPFLTSPAHDGDIHIRHQHCPNELLLDYRDALHPSITDNTVLCDHWQLELAQARIDYGIRLWSATRRSEALSGFDEALDILRNLITAGGLHAYGATFIGWMHWPVGEMLREDGQNVKADALDHEAKTYDPST